MSQINTTKGYEHSAMLQIHQSGNRYQRIDLCEGIGAPPQTSFIAAEGSWIDLKKTFPVDANFAVVQFYQCIKGLCFILSRYSFGYFV